MLLQLEFALKSLVKKELVREHALVPPAEGSRAAKMAVMELSASLISKEGGEHDAHSNSLGISFADSIHEIGQAVSGTSQTGELPYEMTKEHSRWGGFFEPEGAVGL